MLLPMSEAAVPLDRRQRRRQETIEEVLDVAAQVMAEQGVAGLSIGEVARRMGIRPPSLYVYFPSKHALYDALFARGARAVLDVLRSARTTQLAGDDSLEAYLLEAGRTIVSWAVTNPAYSQLLFWRPVPGFQPSADAYAAAVELMELGVEQFTDFQGRGLLRTDIPAVEILRDWTIVTAGVISQQLSNAPDEPFETGSFTTRLPAVAAMFAAHYSPHTPPQPHSTPRASTPSSRRPRRADQR